MKQNMYRHMNMKQRVISALFIVSRQRAHAASASAIVVATRALDSDGDDDDVGVVWALDQLSQAMWSPHEHVQHAPPSVCDDSSGLGGGFNPRHIHNL